MKRSTQSGYVALLTVLIVGAITTAAALALLTTSANSQRSALVEQQSKQARALAVACSEEALQVINENITYTGTASLTFSQGNCSYTITSTGVNTRTVIATGTVNNVAKKIQFNATIGALSISITSWQEIS